MTLKNHLSALMAMLLFLGGCYQKEVKSIDNNTEELSKSADRLADSIENLEVMSLAFIKLLMKSQAGVTGDTTPATEEDHKPGFDSGTVEGSGEDD